MVTPLVVPELVPPVQVEAAMAEQEYVLVRPNPQSALHEAVHAWPAHAEVHRNWEKNPHTTVLSSGVAILSSSGVTSTESSAATTARPRARIQKTFMF